MSYHTGNNNNNNRSSQQRSTPASTPPVTPQPRSTPASTPTRSVSTPVTPTRTPAAPQSFVSSGEPFAVNGYYPLYRTPSAAVQNSPNPNLVRDGEATMGYHVHVLNNAAYYMPNGLDSIGKQFHGDYTPPKFEPRYTTSLPLPGIALNDEADIWEDPDGTIWIYDYDNKYWYDRSNPTASTPPEQSTSTNEIEPQEISVDITSEITEIVVDLKNGERVQGELTDGLLEELVVTSSVFGSVKISRDQIQRINMTPIEIDVDTKPDETPTEIVTQENGVRKYENGKRIPGNFPAAYQNSLNKAGPAGQKCGNCKLFNQKNGYCSAWKATANKNYWCQSYVPYVNITKNGAAVSSSGGVFSLRDSNNKLITYKKGTTVVYDGELYEVTRTVFGQQPDRSGSFTKITNIDDNVIDGGSFGSSSSSGSGGGSSSSSSGGSSSSSSSSSGGGGY